MRLTAFVTSIILLLPASSAAQTRRADPADSGQNAAAAFEEGQNAHARGDLESAVRHYSTAITAAPTLYQAYYQRAVALLQLGRAQEAAADFKKVIELKPDFVRAHRGLGQLLLDQGKTEDAKRALQRALELDPKITGVRIYLASALIKNDANEQAARVLGEAIQLGEGDSLAHALLGVVMERLGKADEAFSIYSRAIEMQSDNATAREGRSRIFETRGEIAKAIEDIAIAWRAQPSSDIALRLARLHVRAAQPQAAIQIYRNLLRERPEDFNLRAEMIRLMAESGQADEAMREVERLVAGQPSNAKMLALAGELCFQSKPELSAAYYSRAVAADAADNNSRVQWGAALVRSQQYEAALTVLGEAIGREPKNYAAHANLATAFFKLKQYHQAAREFIWLLQARPDVAASYYFLAISFDHIGDCPQAVRAYQEFVRRAEGANEKEVEEATIRLGLLERLAKEGKCKGPVKEKSKSDAGTRRRGGKNSLIK